MEAELDIPPRFQGRWKLPCSDLKTGKFKRAFFRGYQGAYNCVSSRKLLVEMAKNYQTKESL